MKIFTLKLKLKRDNIEIKGAFQLCKPAGFQVMKTRCKSFLLFLFPVEIPFVDTDIIYAEKDKIGDGGQGTVYKAFCKSRKLDVAVKVLQPISKETANAAKREVGQCINITLLNKYYTTIR